MFQLHLIHKYGYIIYTFFGKYSIRPLYIHRYLDMQINGLVEKQTSMTIIILNKDRLYRQMDRQMDRYMDRQTDMLSVFVTKYFVSNEYFWWGNKSIRLPTLGQSQALHFRPIIGILVQETILIIANTCCLNSSILYRKYVPIFLF